jgi:dolichol-phosphate mannosyltransferase
VRVSQPDQSPAAAESKHKPAAAEVQQASAAAETEHEPAAAEIEQRVLVIIPTYDEADNLPVILGRLFESVPTAHALVVDDGSPDGTGEIADKLAAEDGRIEVLHRAEKAGLGAAYVAGFRIGLDAGYDVLVEMDADGSHAPEQLPRLLAALAHADVVLGSRWVPGGKVLDWPKSRELISRSGNLYTRMALGIDLKDATGGYRAYRRAVLETIELASVASQGYCFQVDLAWRAVQAGFRVTEVPITFADRERGESKMSSNIVREALLRVTEWGAAHRAAQLRGLLRRR